MKNLNVLERAIAPTPRFFKNLRTIGLVLAAISGSVLAAPIALPAAVITAAGYIAVASSVLSAVAQVTVDEGQLKNESKDS